jgi:hypothetical protein
MKLQDVLLKAMAKKITWWAAAEIIGVSDRTMRRMREKLERDGYAGLADRRKGKASSHRVPLKTAEEVLRLYGEQYSDFNVRHFHEKLRELHQIEISYTTLIRGKLRTLPSFCTPCTPLEWSASQLSRRAELRASSRAVSLNGLKRHATAPCARTRGRTASSLFAVMKTIGMCCPRSLSSR